MSLRSYSETYFDCACACEQTGSYPYFRRYCGGSRDGVSRKEGPTFFGKLAATLSGLRLRPCLAGKGDGPREGRPPFKCLEAGNHVTPRNTSSPAGDRVRGRTFCGAAAARGYCKIARRQLDCRRSTTSRWRSPPVEQGAPLRHVKPWRKAAVPLGTCPECEAEVHVDTDADKGDVVTCEECQTDLEIVGLDPVELDIVEDEGDEEDYGEEDEEEY